MKIALEKPRFLMHPKAQLRGFLPEASKKKGLLTRLREGDPTLLRMNAKFGNDGPEAVEKSIYMQAKATLMANGELC